MLNKTMECFYCIIYLFLIFLLVIILIWSWNWLIGLQKVDGIDKKYIFVTGCDSGFGEALCVELDQLGCHVFAGCLTVEGVISVKNKCSTNVSPIILDIRDHSSIQKCVEYVKLHLPQGKGLWGLVNNAGICGAIGPAQWLNVNDFNEILQVNLLGAIDVTLSLLPLLKSDNERDSARIVNMTSIMAHFHAPCSMPYCISKSSLEVFSNILRLELINSKISVSTIRPGAHESNLTKTGLLSLKKSWERLSPEEQNMFGKRYYEKLSRIESNYISVFARENHRAVLSAYTHALFSKKANYTYIIGLDAMILTLVAYIPDCIYYPIFKISGIFPRPDKYY